MIIKVSTRVRVVDEEMANEDSFVGDLVVPYLEELSSIGHHISRATHFACTTAGNPSREWNQENMISYKASSRTGCSITQYMVDALIPNFLHVSPSCQFHGHFFQLYRNVQNILTVHNLMKHLIPNVPLYHLEIDHECVNTPHDCVGSSQLRNDRRNVQRDIQHPHKLHN